MEIFWKIFWIVFLAEIGDKTQLATMGFSATEPVSKWIVFLAAALALVLASGIGVIAGHVISKLGLEKQIKIVSGVLFIILGIWTLFKE